MDIVPATTDTDISAWTRTQPLAASMAPVPAGTFETPKPAEAEPAPPPEAPKPEKPITETGPDLDAAIAKRKEESAATIRGMEENLLRIRGLMRPIAPPALPRFQDVPKSPDYQLRSGFEAFQNPLTWLAIGGSLLTRRPAIAAMGAAAGAMEGFHQGDDERVKLEQKKFQDQMQAALEQNNKEVQFFNATMANKKFSAAERSAQIEAFAHENQDLVTINALKSGDYNRLFDVFKLRETLKEKAHEAEIRAKGIWGSGTGMPTNLTPAALAQMGGMSPGALEAAAERYLKSGVLPPARGGRNDPSRFIQIAVQNRADELREERGIKREDLPKKWQQFKAQQVAIQRFQSGPQGNTIRSLGVVVDHLATLRDLGEALHNKNIPLFNEIAKQWAVQTGKPQPTSFDMARRIVGDEIVKAMITSGTGALADREDAANAFKRSQSPEQLLGPQGGIATAQRLLAGQLNGLRRQFKKATGLTDEDFDEMLSEQSRTFLEFKSPPAAPGGMPIVDPKKVDDEMRRRGI